MRIYISRHCTDGRTASDMSVRAGSSFHDKDGTIVNVIGIRQHPNYTESTVDNDISILVVMRISYLVCYLFLCI